MNQSNCPICKNQIIFSVRYPRAVCDYCQSKTVDADGNQVKFFNTHDDGSGFESHHQINFPFN